MKQRRDIELSLLLAALPVLLLLFALLFIQQSNSLSLSSFAVPLGLFAAFCLAHLATRRFAPNADPALLPIAFLLSGIGICFVMRLAPNLAMRQLAWLFLGVAIMIGTLILIRSLEKLARYKYIVMLGGLILLLLPALIGVEYYGSKIWLSIAGMSFQPGEIAKVLIIIFLAAYMADKREMLSVGGRRIGPLQIPDLASLAPLLAMWLVAMLIVVFERDLGSALLVFGIFLIMLYICTGRLSYVLAGAGLVLVGFVGAYFGFSHVRVRVQAWLNPFAYADSSGYQIIQAIYSMADGGLFGTGIGRGLPTKIPVVESDFIFAAIAEEMGLLGAAGVLLGFLLFAIRGFLTAARAKSDLAAFTAAGLTSAISLQAFIIVGGIVRLIPLTGLTLPFMSQGGSSLLASFMILALLLRAGDEGTGVQSELQGRIRRNGGVLGRSALGKRLVHALLFFAICFALCIAGLSYVQVIRADYYQNLPTNNHSIANSAKDERGSILSSDNLVLAQSVQDEDGDYQREYPQGSLACFAVGYYSNRFGSSGIESFCNDELAGKSASSSWTQAIAGISGAGQRGNDVILSIDSVIQRAAEACLVDKTGAIVALDPKTGAVLAMASSPGFDPSDIASIMDGTNSSASLYNRATQALYAPGSTFKIVTLSAALEYKLVEASTQYDSPASIEIGGSDITNYNHQSHGRINIVQAMAYSSNTVFAQIASQLGAKTLLRAAGKFGIGSPIGQDFQVTVSLMPKAEEMTEWETAWAGVGQPVGEHESPAGPQVTVMQMALVGAAVANGGVIMNPYLVKEVISAEGVTLHQTQPEELSIAMSQDVADQTLDIMYQGIAAGSAANIEGVKVAGKTGTAQTGKEVDDAWFIGIAPADDPQIVVAVIVEEGGSGAGTAAPLAKKVLEAGLIGK